MAGKGDKFPEEAQQTLAEVILEWQRQGAGLDVKPHGHFTGSECPGHDVAAWLPQKLWALQEKKAPVKDETPDWLMDFVYWRLVDNGDAAKRPKSPARADPGLGLGDGLAGAPDRQPDGPAGPVPRLGGVAWQGREEGRAGRGASRRRFRSRGGRR